VDTKVIRSRGKRKEDGIIFNVEEHACDYALSITLVSDSG